MGFNIYKYFPAMEKWSLLLESVEYRISKRISPEIRIKRQLLNRFLGEGVPVKIKKNGIEFEYRVNDKNLKFYLRNNSSDINVFTQIVLEQEYKPIIDMFKRLNLSPDRFIDAGANVGFSSLYLLAHWPEARFICLEPHPGNFEALTCNITQNISTDNFLLLQKALWSKPAQLSGDNNFRDGRDWSFNVKEDGKSNGNIEGITIDMVMNQDSFNEVDFLKIDIEGAEVQLFESRKNVESWIDKIKVISIEIHDETNVRFKIENMLQNMGFRIYHSGEITIAINKRFIHLLLSD